MTYEFFRATGDKRQWEYVEQQTMPYCQKDGATVAEWYQYNAKQYATKLAKDLRCAIRYQPAHESEHACYVN